MKIKHLHFAYDRYKDGSVIIPKLEQLRNITGWDRHKVTVYILTNYDTTPEQDIERIEAVKRVGFQPYVMIYDKQRIKRGSITNKIARYANNSFMCWAFPNFQEFARTCYKGDT